MCETISPGENTGSETVNKRGHTRSGAVISALVASGGTATGGAIQTGLGRSMVEDYHEFTTN